MLGLDLAQAGSARDGSESGACSWGRSRKPSKTVNVRLMILLRKRRNQVSEMGLFCSARRTLLIVQDHLRCRSATADSSFGEFGRFKSATGRIRCGEPTGHPLKLRRLLFKPGQHNVHFLFLFFNGGLQFLDFAVLFEKLIEQHGIDRFVADRFRFAIPMPGHKVGIDLSHFLGNQPKRERARWINLLLVTEAHRPEGEDRFAGLRHRPDLILVAPGGGKRPDFVIAVDVNGPGSGDRIVNIADASSVALASNASDLVTDADVATPKSSGAGYGNRIRIGPNNGLHIGVEIADKATVVHVRACGLDTNNVTGCCHNTGTSAQCDVAVAAGIAKERTITDSCIAGASLVAVERMTADGRVTTTVVGEQCSSADGRVTGAGGVQ